MTAFSRGIDHRRGVVAWVGAAKHAKPAAHAERESQMTELRPNTDQATAQAKVPADRLD